MNQHVTSDFTLIPFCRRNEGWINVEYKLYHVAIEIFCRAGNVISLQKKVINYFTVTSPGNMLVNETPV